MRSPSRVPLAPPQPPLPAPLGHRVPRLPPPPAPLGHRVPRLTDQLTTR